MSGEEGVWALALHGGAGTIPKSTPPQIRDEYLSALHQALEIGKRKLVEQKASALDVVEEVVKYLEDNPLFNAGRGSVFTNEGRVEMDASIMDGSNLRCGAVAAVTTIKNPVSLARLVMTNTSHILLAAEGAEKFGKLMGVERREAEYFFVERRWRAYLAAKEKEAVELDHAALAKEGMKNEEKEKEKDNKEKEKDKHKEKEMENMININTSSKGTVGCVALDFQGNLAAATSTGGMTNKRFGRIGDSPIIGAGTYANNETCAVSTTGTGEEFIRHVVGHDVSCLMAYRSLPLAEAAHIVIHQKLKPGDGGLIAVGKDGSVAMPFNSEGMFRAAANSKGLNVIQIWDEEQPGSA